MRQRVSPAAASTPKWFSISGLRLYFPALEPWGCEVCFAPPLFLLVYLHANVGPLGPPATSLLQVLSSQLRVSAPPTSLDGCFFFNSLVVRLPYSLIFWQFWLFFVFKFVVILLLVVQGEKCIYLHLHLGRKS